MAIPPFNPNELCVRTIPKAGTFLLANILGELRLPSCLRHVTAFDKDFDKCSDKKIYGYRPAAYYKRGSGKSTRAVILIRDPRDNIIALVDFIFAKKMNPGYYGSLVTNPSLYSNFENRLFEAITLDPKSDIHGLFYAQMAYYKKAAQYYKEAKKNLLFIRFEDIVPVQNSSSQTLDNQFQTIKKIVKFHGKKVIKDADILRVLQSTIPRGFSYNSLVQEKVGRWKKHFSQRYLEAFKNSVWNQILVDLDYETDLNWCDHYSKNSPKQVIS